MANLGRMARALGTPLLTLKGQTIYGVFQKATAPREHYDAEFLTRKMLTVDGDQIVPPGTVIQKQDGTRLLMFPWSDNAFKAKAGLRMFALFEVNVDRAWTRQQSTVEPISGLKAQAAPLVLGTVACAQDAWNPKVDALEIEKPTFHVICNAALQVDDYLDDLRVRRVVNNRGFTFASIF